MKYIYNDKLNATLTEMREQKWKNMKNRKAQSFARIGPDAGQEKLGARSCRAPTVHLKWNRGIQNNVCLKYLYLTITINRQTNKVSA